MNPSTIILEREILVEYLKANPFQTRPAQPKCITSYARRAPAIANVMRHSTGFLPTTQRHSPCAVTLTTSSPACRIASATLSSRPSRIPDVM